MVLKVLFALLRHPCKADFLPYKVNQHHSFTLVSARLCLKAYLCIYKGCFVYKAYVCIYICMSVTVKQRSLMCCTLNVLQHLRLRSGYALLS